MKILIATPIYPPEIGGPATYTKELCERLHDKHQITVVAFTDNQEAFPQTKLISVRKRSPMPIRLLRFFFRIITEGKNMNVIYVQNAMAAGLPVALASKIIGVPFVLKFVGDEAWERASQEKRTKKRLEEFLENPEGGLKTKLMMAIQGFVLRRASIVTTPSAYLSEVLIRVYKIDRKRAVVNYNAAEETETLPFETERIPHQIATTARLVAWKGVDGIIEAVALLKDEIPDLKFSIAGEGPEMENLKALAEKLKVSDRVNFLGRISRAETWQLRKNSELYVLNSTYEGLPHTVLTSFAAEIPTIATNIPGTNEAIYDEKTGLLVEAENPKQLADAIKKLLDNKPLQDKLVHEGSKLLKEKFSWEAHINNLNKILESVLLKPSN